MQWAADINPFAKNIHILWRCTPSPKPSHHICHHHHHHHQHDIIIVIKIPRLKTVIFNTIQNNLLFFADMSLAIENMKPTPDPTYPLIRVCNHHHHNYLDHHHHPCQVIIILIIIIIIVIIIVVRSSSSSFSGRTSDHYETSGSSVTSSINSANHTDRFCLSLPIHHSYISDICSRQIFYDISC